MTLAGAKQRLKQERELEVRNVDIIERLKDIKKSSSVFVRSSII